MFKKKPILSEVRYNIEVYGGKQPLDEKGVEFNFKSMFFKSLSNYKNKIFIIPLEWYLKNIIELF